jgi:D-serine deaminase-like pyridoxal phosphate-dependent protein
LSPAGRAVKREPSTQRGIPAPRSIVAMEVVPGTPVEELATPAPLVDLDRLERNLDRWQGGIAAAGVRLRPHVKTHKIPAIAAMQLERGAAGIASAKLAEASVFAARGARDLVIAYPLVGREKWRRAAALAAEGVRLTVNVESPVAAAGLSEAASERGVRIHVQLEIDTGLGRVGIEPSALDEIVALARVVEKLPGLELEGITTHRGMGFPGAESLTPAEAGEEEGRLLVELANRLRELGVRVHEVTAGGTITGRAVAAVPGITEVRAGTYVFNDLMQLRYGSATEDDLAFSILCTVVSRRGGRATVDGGSKTWSGDVRLPHEGRPGATIVARAVDRPAYVDTVTEEHGVVHDGAETLEVGQRLAFYPAHVCTCVNLSDVLYGVRDGVVVEAWPVLARGART